MLQASRRFDSKSIVVKCIHSKENIQCFNRFATLACYEYAARRFYKRTDRVHLNQSSPLGNVECQLKSSLHSHSIRISHCHSFFVQLVLPPEVFVGLKSLQRVTLGLDTDVKTYLTATLACSPAAPRVDGSSLWSPEIGRILFTVDYFSLGYPYCQHQVVAL